jgi:hypothetical protein
MPNSGSIGVENMPCGQLKKLKCTRALEAGPGKRDHRVKGTTASSSTRRLIQMALLCTNEAPCTPRRQPVPGMHAGALGGWGQCYKSARHFCGAGRARGPPNPSAAVPPWPLATELTACKVSLPAGEQSLP